MLIGSSGKVTSKLEFGYNCTQFFANFMFTIVNKAMVTFVKAIIYRWKFLLGMPIILTLV
jgi:hypothetical protein